MSNRFLLERERTALGSEIKDMDPENRVRGTIDSIKQIQTILTNILLQCYGPVNGCLHFNKWENSMNFEKAREISARKTI